MRPIVTLYDAETKAGYRSLKSGGIPTKRSIGWHIGRWIARAEKAGLIDVKFG